MLNNVLPIKLVVLLYFHFCYFVMTQIITALNFSYNHVKTVKSLKQNGVWHTGQTVNALSGLHDKYHKV